jgi:hypothetical protein
MKKVLYIVHAIDAEGPLYQSNRTYKKYATEVKKNNKFLKNNSLLKILNSNLNKQTIGSKNKLIKKIKLLCSNNFRRKSIDSSKNGWVYNWFILNHNGWKGKNPRKRLLGSCSIFDLYKIFFKMGILKKDGFYFHYHPKPLSEDYHRSGYTVSNSDHLTATVSKLLIDRDYFPNCFRAGHTAERFDLHVFLEQWIPFDFSNHSIIKKNNSATSRFGNWKDADKTWSPYNPDFYDYQKKGNCKRWISRSLPIFSRDYSINNRDVVQAFKEANEKGKALLSFFGHDFKDMEIEVKIIRDKIEKIRSKFKNVKIKYSTALEAIRSITNLKNKKFLLQAKIVKKKGEYTKLVIKSNKEIFGTQPYLAIKINNKYYWQNFDYDKKNLWSYTFDEHNVLIKDVQKLSIAANSNYGKTIILKLNKKNNKFQKFNFH